MITRSSAPAVFTIGLLLACVAGLAACIEVAMLDRRAVEADAGRLLRTSQVESSLRPRAAAVLAAVAPPGSTFGGDPGTAAEAMLVDPSFTAAFRAALGSVSRHVLEGETGPIVLDPVLVHTAAVAAVSARDPNSVGRSAAGPGPTVALDADAIPALPGADSAIRFVGSVAGILGVILIVAGIVMSEQRIRAAARLGRWIAGAGVFVLLAFWLVPELVLPLLGGWTEVAGVVMSSGGAFLVPGVALVTIGVALSFAANRLADLGRGHTLSVVPKAPRRRVTAADKKWRNSA